LVFRRAFALSREKEVDRRTAGVHRPVQVRPFTFHPHVRLVHPPGVVGWFKSPTQTLFQFRAIAPDPSPDGHVIHREHHARPKAPLRRGTKARSAKYQPSARRMTSGSNWRHLNRPQTRIVHKEHSTSLSRLACKVATLTPDLLGRYWHKVLH
jgi:hypothetical protein